MEVTKLLLLTKCHHVQQSELPILNDFSDNKNAAANERLNFYCIYWTSTAYT